MRLSTKLEADPAQKAEKIAQMEAGSLFQDITGKAQNVGPREENDHYSETETARLSVKKSRRSQQVYSLKHQLGKILMGLADSTMLRKFTSGVVRWLAQRSPDRNQAPLGQIQISTRARCVQATRPTPLDGKKRCKKDEATDIGARRMERELKGT